ncbi:hypothetical protein [Arthrobacter sp. UYCo732]|uniref:hypothetical protein n=1 Tax=Arthrobacter sp. UYCo732 TaxID=3156336 RepID=UPI003395A84C
MSAPAVFSVGTGIYRASVLKVPADAARLQGDYVQTDDMYNRGGSDRSIWIQFSGSVLIERLGEDGKPVDQDVLLASEFNTRFGFALPTSNRT